MGRRQHERRYRVHLIKSVRVAVGEILAADAEEAIEIAELAYDWEHLFRDVKGVPSEADEDTTGMLVDRIGDTEYRNSQFFDSKTNPCYAILRALEESEHNPALITWAIDEAKRLLRTML